MKKNRVVLILFVVLAAVAGYLFYSQSQGTIKPELKDFAVADTAAIDKIFMADRSGNSVTLLRKSADTWSVNDKYQAKPEGINTLLYTIKALEMRSPVGKNMYNNLMKKMASKSIKVEIYQQQQLVKTYYVGDATMDNLGTFMYLEGSSVPFVMHIPGFNGYLTSRYYAGEQEWRDRGLLHCKPQDITLVNITVPLSFDSSFTIKKVGTDEYTITNGNQQQLVAMDKAKLHSYLSGFAHIYYNRIDAEMNAKQRDSIVKAGPYQTLTVNVEGDQNLDARLYRKPVSATTRSQYDESTGKIWSYDLDNFYLLREGDTTWYKCQYGQFDRLLKTPHYFLPAGIRK